MRKIGRYEVVEEVGRGAMGVVYKASDPTIGRLVAIKVLSLDSSSAPGVPGAQEIFLREARAAGRLSHPGIVTIHDALEDPETKTHYIVMEFIPGRTLENILLYGPPLSTEKAIEIIREIAIALDYAHQQRIIHRDLKPANILLTDDGRAKITDFGIAKILSLDGALRTTSVMGTPAYMSPEQVTGGEIDARSDLFALGILFYLMLAGEKPFAGDTVAVMFKIVYEDPVPPSQLRPELGAGHDYLVLRCLVKDPSKRYGSAREFLDDLDDVQHGRLPRSEAKFPLSEIRKGERTLVARPVRLPWGEQMAPALGKKWTRARAGMGAAVGLLLVLLGSGVLLYRRRHEPKAPPAVAQPAATLPAAQGISGEPAASPSTSKPNEAGAQNSKIETAGAETSARSQLTNQPAVNAAVFSPTRSSASKNKKVKASVPAAPPREPIATPTVIQVVCKFELRQADLTVSSDAGVILRGNLTGKKRGGLLRLKGGYTGVFSQPISIPAGTQDLFVRVVSTDGGLDLKRKISLSPRTNAPTALQVDVRPDRLSLHWVASSHP